LIKTVLFDLDDTIFDFSRAEHSAISQTFRELGIDPTDEVISLYSRINQEQWERLQRNEIDRDEVRIGRFRRLFAILGIDADAVNTQRVYEYNLGSYHYYIDGAEDLLKALYKRYDLYIVSNGTTSVQDRRIAASGIAKYFKDIFISERVGYNKPSVEFFNFCIDRIKDFDKDSAIIIGDSLTSDILGGKNVGIKTCHYQRAGVLERGASCDIIPDYRVNSLDEIISLLEKL